MAPFFSELVWYPPAETKVPASAILNAFRMHKRNFKDELCDYLNVEHCILGVSARALLFKLLETLKKLDIGQRDEVLIPGYTCYSVAAAVAKAHLKISVYDLDHETLAFDLESLEKAISEKTLAIVVQHLFGRITPLDELKRIAKKKNVFLIEDSAQALGKVKGAKITGITGDFGIFSFGRGKPLPVGRGGALVSREHLDILDGIKLKSHENGYKTVAASAITQIISKKPFYWIPEILPLGLGETIFDINFLVTGISYKLEIMLSCAMSILNQLNAHRLRVSRLYSQLVSNQYQIQRTGHVNSIIRFPVLLPNMILTKEMKRLGVRRMYPKPIKDEIKIQPYLKPDQEPTPGATEIAKKLFTLPTHMGINNNVALQIVHTVRKAIGEDN